MGWCREGRIGYSSGVRDVWDGVGDWGEWKREEERIGVWWAVPGGEARLNGPARTMRRDVDPHRNSRDYRLPAAPPPPPPLLPPPPPPPSSSPPPPPAPSLPPLPPLPPSRSGKLPFPNLSATSSYTSFVLPRSQLSDPSRSTFAASSRPPAAPPPPPPRSVLQPKSLPLPRRDDCALHNRDPQHLNKTKVYKYKFSGHFESNSASTFPSSRLIPLSSPACSRLKPSEWNHLIESMPERIRELNEKKGM